MKRLGLIVMALGALVGGERLNGNAAETVRQDQGSATLEVHFDTPLTLADMLTATLTITAAASDEISTPRSMPADAKWLLVDGADEQRETIKPGVIRWRQMYRFAPKEPGAWPFVFPDVKRRDAKGDEQIFIWEPIRIEVAPPTIAPDRSALRGTPGIETSPPPPPADAFSPWWPLTALIPFALLIWLWRRWRRRRRPASPLDRARYELDRLSRMKQVGGERFIALLSMLLREYLERSFDWPARRQTTAELLARCAQSSLGAEPKQFLIEFFERSDLIKFAGIDVTTEEGARWAERAWQFLDGQARSCAQTAEQNPPAKNGQKGEDHFLLEPK